ncbi:hypothetical protein [Aeromonas hydrophila]|uniref:hypothetical protein n=1 Tax=Aeromonas hydrophila TaxID=644 RepID=UPI002B46AC54|nr:hypothetical protein [Aeromonas hydrophila]
MDWEDLLHSLRDLLAPRGSTESEKHVLDLLKERTTDNELYSRGQTLDDWQLDQAKIVACDILRDHPDLLDIIRNLELKSLCDRHKAAHLPAHKNRNREQLLQSVNVLVSSGKLVAAEELLEEELAENEDPELLDLLGRVYVLQSRPKQAAALMQQAFLAKRQQSAFLDLSPEIDVVSESDDETITATDLEYITADASVFDGLDPFPSLRDEVYETVILPVPLSVTEDTRVISANEREILSLARACKHVDVASAAQRPKTLVCHAPHFKVVPSHSTQVSVTADDVLSEATPQLSQTPKEAIIDYQWPSGSESYYSDSHIQELVGGIDFCGPYESLLDFGGYQVNQPDSYEPEDDFFDNDEIFVEQDDLYFGVADELDIHDDQNDDEFAAYAFDPDDVYDSQGSFDSDTELFDERLSREDRALQKAVELISRAGWSLSMLPLVQQIFVMNGWGATRLALEREIDKGMSPDELILAAHVKALWAENDYYWIAYDRNGSSNLSQYVMSWPTALMLIRAFESLPQIEEIEQFIESLFEYWYDRSSLRRAFRSFNRFLWFRICNLPGCLPATLAFNFCSPHELPVEEYSDLGISDLLVIEQTAKLRAYGVFQTKHPQEPSCYASDKPISVDAYSMATQTSKEISIDV